MLAISPSKAFASFLIPLLRPNGLSFAEPYCRQFEHIVPYDHVRQLPRPHRIQVQALAGHISLLVAGSGNLEAAHPRSVPREAARYRQRRIYFEENAVVPAIVELRR